MRIRFTQTARRHATLFPASGLLTTCLLMSSPCMGQTLYDFGNPSPDEQQYIEHINRSRAYPAAEGAKFAATTDPAVLAAYASYGVDLAMMQSEFNALAARPPLAPNAKLTTICRNHSAWMLSTGTQAHDETNPTKTLTNRLTDIGYPYSTAGENIFAFVSNVWHGHAGLDVDWGSGASGTIGGMQNPRGHRNNIHSSNFREIGVGVVFGSNTGPSGTVGPQLVTQDFGTQSSSPTFGTGVVYYDLNSNNTYDVGEGISGLTVNVSGASYYCNSASGGGWTVPVPTTATTRTVSFSGLNLSQSINLVVPASTNAKADLKLTYSPPAITSASNVVGGNPHTVTFDPVGGATGYTWTRSLTAPATAENCESTTNVTVSKTGTYATLNSNVKQQGATSFHLENSTGASQSVQLNTLFYGGSSPSVAFQSFVRYATTSERFKVQVKEEGSTVWQDVYSQTGTGTSGEAGFNARSANLSSMTGKSFRLRFLLNYASGSYYTTSGDIVGWFVDAVSFTNVSALTSTVTQSLASTSGSFTPAPGSTYLMSVAPVISGRDFPASYQTLTATAGAATPPEITGQPTSVTINSGATASFTVTATGTSPTYQWYQGNSGVTSNPVSGATGSSYTTAALTSTTNYWVRVSNSAGNVDSNSVTATVITPVAITQQPVPVTINSGNTATFSVTASGTSPTYQWYQGNSGITTNPISGATGSSYTTPTLTSSASYWVRVSNAAGSQDSNTATATVITQPAIIEQPASTTIASGSTTTFTVTATGGNLAYQWYSGLSGNTSSPISGATASSYTTPALTTSSSYWVRVSNSVGTVNSNTATVTVNYPPMILSQPVSPTVAKNTSPTLTVIASGPALTYQWYSGTPPSKDIPISGAISSSYTPPSSKNATTDDYWVCVTNTAGSANSVKARVTTINSTTVTRNYSVWAGEIETANNLAPGSLTNGNGDYDQDGRSNLIEYAFGASPIVANDAAPRMPVMQITATQCALQYQVDTTITDITVTPIAGSNPNQWFAPGAGGAPAGFTDSLISTNGNIQTRRAVLPKSSGAKGFLRIRVTRP